MTKAHPAVVTISPGRFHHFDAARQLAKRDALRRFYVGYPRFQLRKHNFALPETVVFPWFVTPYMALTKFGLLPFRLKRIFDRISPWSLDLFAATTLPDCDAVLALSNHGLRTGRKAQRRGAVFVCDRGSSHIRRQQEILTEEFRRWEDQFVGIDPWVIKREESEYSLADLITVPSHFVFRTFAERGVPCEKIRILPYGVDVEKFKPVGKPADAQFDVLFVGQVGFRKGVPDVLDAFARLNHPKKRLRVVGGIQPEMRRFLASCSLSSDVEFIAHVPHAELKTFMSTSHVMVLPSVEEGLALVMAEAMACGCPIIASTNTGAETLFSDGAEGFIIPIRAPELLADRLQHLADRPDLRAEMSAAALTRVRQMGGWDSYGAALLEILCDAMKNQHANASAGPPNE